MKVFFIRITMLALLVLLVGCYYSNGETNSISTKETEIGVNMIIHLATPNGISISLENTTDKNYTYGEAFLIYVYSDNSWERVEPIIDNGAFILIDYALASQSTSDVIFIDWTWLYGELSSGDYKFQKEILYFHNSGDYDIYTLENEFSIN